ncbi:MAG: mandelate racemase/muconate lactonizing enzyme family protein [Alphaproteobacteria bacterium]|jgi:L-alanine-DL-glutamate epimerase-like enolase superfamily enzyme|nr:mandelate racemase/muconate lactonizing enzyme family protein [Alphaproteobacteria bacterium]
MKITKIEDLHCDAGWRVFSFLKVETDEGIVGYSEYNETYGAKGLTAVIRSLAEGLIGQDPRPVERITAWLYAKTRAASGGLNAQAIAAIENALVDVKAKALGVPVYEMLGGPVRERLRLYWSHCGSYRLDHAEAIGAPPLTSLDGIRDLGAQVAESGLTALKCNIFLFDEDEPFMHMPGFTRSPGWPELNPSRRIIAALDEQLTAFREGTGPDVEFLLDLNFNFKTEGYVRVARALEPHDLFWVELDIYDPRALALIRRSIRTPVASCESLYGRRQFRDFFENYAMDVAIVDVPWNGILESLKIAAMAEAYEVNVAPHNFYGHLSTLMSAHFCAALPNFRIMEIDIDDVPWKDDLVTEPPRIEDGHLVLPTGPGWGADLNEEAIRAHPPK